MEFKIVKKEAFRVVGVQTKLLVITLRKTIV